MSCALAAITFSASAGNAGFAPEGLLQVAANGNTVKVSWIFDNSVFSGVAEQYGSIANLALTEVALYSDNLASLDTVGNGTGSKTDTVGNGTGSKTDTVGNGTGSKTETVGNGTGSSTETVGNGTGSSTETVGNGNGSRTDTVGNGTGSNTDTVGNGTGSSTDTVGNGTGSNTDTVGNGTGSNTDTVGNGTGSNSDGAFRSGSTVVLTVGNGTGAEAIAITLPGDGGMHMEVALTCKTATVYVLDSEGYEVVSFDNVAVAGNTGLCDGDSGYFDVASMTRPDVRFSDGRF